MFPMNGALGPKIIPSSSETTITGIRTLVSFSKKFFIEPKEILNILSYNGTPSRASPARC